MIQLAVSCCELYFARCILCPETDWNIHVGKQVYVIILTDSKKRCFDVSFVAPIFVNNYFETFFFKIN